MRLVLIGAPNSGKSIQSCLIEEKHAIPRLAINELIRQAVADNTVLGQQAKLAIDLDKTIQDDILLGLIEERIGMPDAKPGFVLDGFPTNMDQAQALDNLLQTLGRPLHLIILLDTDFDALMQRVTGRLSCRSCGHVCNQYTSPPKMDGQCDECGGNLRSRSDDDEEIISNRLRIYEIQMMPVIDYYREQERLRAVQGIGEVDDIFAAIQGVIDSVDTDEEPMPSVETLEKIILEKAQAAQEETDEDAPEATEKPKAKKAVKKKVAAKKQAPKKKAVTRKASTKKATAKKKVASKKAPAKKPVKKKAATAKTAVKKNIKKKKVTTKKTPVKAARKKSADSKKTTAKKAPVKKKTVSKKAPVKKKAAAAKTATKKSIKKKKAPVKKKKR